MMNRIRAWLNKPIRERYDGTFFDPETGRETEFWYRVSRWEDMVDSVWRWLEIASVAVSLGLSALCVIAFMIRKLFAI